MQNVNATAFKSKSKVQVLPPYISLTFVNAVSMAPGYLLNAQCTFAEIIRSISQREAKNSLICRIKVIGAVTFEGL